LLHCNLPADCQQTNGSATCSGQPACPHILCPACPAAGIISAIAAAIAAAGFKTGNGSLLTSSQSGWQIAALLACIAVACASGYVAGLLVKHVNLTRSPQMRGSEMFDDAVFWARVEGEEAEEAGSDDGDVMVKGCQA
jgi:hypothetical protein